MDILLINSINIKVNLIIINLMIKIQLLNLKMVSFFKENFKIIILLMDKLIMIIMKFK